MKHLVCKAAKKGQPDVMEDRHLIADITLPGKGIVDIMAIFDGHNGEQVAEELLNIFPAMLADKLDTISSLGNPIEIADALYESVLETDYKMYQGRGFESGSTALVLLWPRGSKYLYICNIGDSRAVLWDDTGIILETADHKVQDERLRIKLAKGSLQNGLLNGTEDVSRSFGYYTNGLKLIDNQYRGVDAPMSIKPDIYRLNKPGDGIKIVLASDGLWSVMSTQQVVDFFNAGGNCGEIIDLANLNGSNENITVLFFKK